jgi:hypothetical protein
MKKVVQFANVVNANTSNYREVREAAIAYFTKANATKFYVRKKIAMFNYVYEISFMNDSFALRQKENVCSESRTLDVILTRLFEELRMF